MRPVHLLAVAIGLLVLAGCSRQESAWRQAERQGSVAAYEDYLRDYPAGAHAPEARARLSDLREQQEWDRALRFNTPEAFQRYLSRFPSGRYAQAARERLSEFVLGRSPDAAGPVSPPVAEPPAPPPGSGKLIAAASAGGDFRVQLGAFSAGEAAARRAWQDLSSKHGDLLGGLVPRIDVIRKQGRSLWRLQAGPLTESRARAVCTSLEARGAACLVVRA